MTTETDEEQRLSLAAVAERHGAVLLPRPVAPATWLERDAAGEIPPGLMGTRLVALEQRVARLEDRRTAGPAVADNAVKEEVRAFLLDGTDGTEDASEGTWATELYGWYCAWCAIEKKRVPVSGIVFLRVARAFKGVSTRRRQVRNKDEVRNGVVYLVKPSTELRAKCGDLFAQLVPEPEEYVGGPGVMKTIRQKAERRLTHS